MSVEITNRLLQQGASERGGWTRAQYEILGVKWPVAPDWKKRVLGQMISDEDASRFLALKGVTKRTNRRRGLVVEVRVGEPLPLPPHYPVQDENTLKSFWIYLQRLDPATLQKALPALQFMARSSHKKVQGLQTNP